MTNGNAPHTPRVLGRLQAAILTILLCLIVIAANPFGPLRPLADRVWPVLYALGIDVAMTPLTFDMMMMYDPKSNTSFYQHLITVVYQTARGDVTVPLEALSFYRWRIPVILFMEEFFWKADTRAHRYALCHELAQLTGPGTAFMVRLDLEDGGGEPHGLNRFHACP